MSKPLRVPLEDLAPGVRQLDAPAARYVARVHRLGRGDPLLVFDPARGLEAEARVSVVGRSSVTCQVGEVRPSAYRPEPVHLVVALTKADKPDQTIRDATALGVARVTLAEAERSIVQLDAERGAARKTRWLRVATEAARQCGRGNLPVIDGPLPLPEALSRVADGRRLLLAPSGPALLDRLGGWQPGESAALLVGPEGGFETSEVELAEALGFAAASLGDTVLRSELAAVAGLAAVVAFCRARGIG